MGYIIGFITRLNSDGLKGTISDHAIMGDSSISVDKIKFSIPNLYEIHRGTLIKRTNLHTQPDRLILEDDIYIITIDKCSNYKERMEALDEYSGYYIQYNGEITIKKGVMTHTNIKELFSCLNTFLTFLNGKKTSSLFIHGIFEEKIIWTDFTPYMVDLHINVLSWANISEITDFNTLWIEFRTLWQNEENKDFLKSLIHWYVESNKQKYLRDGAIILGQTALELVYNWWIVENKQMIIGDDAKDLSAANKIRLIISQLQISSKVPKAFTKLQELMSKDAPEAIVGIRNSIVHSQAEKRSKLRSYDNIALYEALQVFIWYIE